jgi:hypothetical protein
MKGRVKREARREQTSWEGNENIKKGCRKK